MGLIILDPIMTVLLISGVNNMSVNLRGADHFRCGLTLTAKGASNNAISGNKVLYLMLLMKVRINIANVFTKTAIIWLKGSLKRRKHNR
jgi:hypothetical protein